jgi:hypothetical protein
MPAARYGEAIACSSGRSTETPGCDTGRPSARADYRLPPHGNNRNDPLDNLTSSDGRLLRGRGSWLDQLWLRYSHTSSGPVIRYLP